jgi:CrcB protein
MHGPDVRLVARLGYHRSTVGTVQQLIGVFVAGGIGACLRVGLAGLIDDRQPRIPLGTLAVNLLGCLAIGLAATLLVRTPWRGIVMGGLLGGFTTYSSFALISWELLRADRLGATVVLVTVHVVGGVLAVALGVWIGGALGGDAPQ